MCVRERERERFYYHFIPFFTTSMTRWSERTRLSTRSDTHDETQKATIYTGTMRKIPRRLSDVVGAAREKQSNRSDDAAKDASQGLLRGKDNALLSEEL